MQMRLNATLALLIALTAAGIAHGQPGTGGEGVPGREVVAGQFAPLTGPSASLGQRVRAGIVAYFGAVNSSGGVHGRTLRLVSRDDQYEPDKTVKVLKTLLEEDKVFALIGPVGTATNLAVLPTLKARGIPVVGMVTGSPSLREPFTRNVFHVRASYNDEAEKIVQQIVTLQPSSRIALMYQNDEYGKAGLNATTAALSKRGMTLAASVPVERNSVDVNAAVDTLLKAQPTAIIQVSAYKTVASFIKAAKSKGYLGQFYNVSFVGAKALSDELGELGSGSVVIAQVVPYPFTSSSTLAREYQQHMKEFSDGELDFSSMEGYVYARVFVEGLQHVGRNLNRETFIAALESMRSMPFEGKGTSGFSPTDHQGSNFVELTILGPGGRFTH